MKRMSTRIKEVILENFMSYEYCRIPFKSGLNIITGPNGAGKSSILLAISVALGQSHTERSRRLSDLIRRGKDYAYVSVVLDNSPLDGRRPFPSIKTDELIISRILRRDGQYIFQLNYRASTKAEISRILRRVGINPDNMLIIMHQNMIEEFGYISGVEKLKMFEEALGISEYRERIIDSIEKLRRISGEEAEVKSKLSDVKNALDELKKKYDRLLEKRNLMKRLDELNLEYAWSKVVKVEYELAKFKDEVSKAEEDLHNLNIELMRIKHLINEVDKEFNKCIEDLMLTFDNILSANIIDNIARYKLRDYLADKLDTIKLLKSRYGVERGKESITEYKISVLTSRIRELKSVIDRLESELRDLRFEASQLGSKPSYVRNQQDILAEIRSIKAKLELYKDVDESVEDTYLYYKDLYSELEARMNKIIEDRKCAEQELKRRIKNWQDIIQNYIGKVSKEYNKILNGLGGSGYARVTNIDDIYNASLELYVGYGGIEPSILDAYTQSGGERTTAIMAFLLALQQYVKSPFRIVDEFDIHMDPRNREAILSYLINVMKGRSDQYIIVTPGYIPKDVEDAHIIVVQKVKGVSLISSVKA